MQSVWNSCISKLILPRESNPKFKYLIESLRVWEKQLSRLKEETVDSYLVICLLDDTENYKELSLRELDLGCKLKQHHFYCLENREISRSKGVKWVTLGDEQYSLTLWLLSNN